MKKPDLSIERLTFEKFKELAGNPELSKYEKIGFPDDYRKGYEELILLDISNKLQLNRTNLKVLDIGCGVSDLATLIMNLAQEKNHELFLMDSDEMLSLLPEYNNIKKTPCKFPDCKEFIVEHQNTFDSIIVYSIMQHVILDSNPFTFIDNALKLLRTEGLLLLADLPNISKRNRFLSSERGIAYHKNMMHTIDNPIVIYNEIQEEKIDDGIVLAILQRYRNFGFETYLLPQKANMPLANRREDILIMKN